MACILAGYGSQDINKIISDNSSRERTKLMVVVGMVALVAAAAYFWILRTVHLSFDAFRHPSKLFVILWLSILVLLFLWSRRDVSIRLLLVGFVVIAIYDASSALKISIPTMYSGASTPWWKVMSSKHVESLDLTSNGLARQLYPPDELGGRYQHNRNVVLRVPVFANDTGMVNQFFQPYVADSVLNQLAVGTQRIWFSAHPIWSPPNAKTFDDYVKISHTLGLPPLILHSREEMMAGSARLDGPPKSDSAQWIHSARPVSPATIELVNYSPNSLAFRYNAAEDGWLLVSDRWAPDWIVTVNGHPAPIAGANFLFRGIPVSQGENTVLFSYQPRGYLSMVILSWIVIGLVVAWEVARRRLPRARSTNPVLENARS